ncbi:MAG: VOC family protein [Pirellulales bacterium]|nr:VOC family protein [Pirellulales bacterium]
MTQAQPQQPLATGTNLDSLHHVAISVRDIAEAVNWYTSNFRCTISYQDATWALLTFANTQLALVIPEQHPPHIAFSHPQAEKYGPLKAHRDGTRSTYIADCAGNVVELMAE